MTRRRGCILALGILMASVLVAFPSIPGQLLTLVQTGLHDRGHRDRLLAAITGRSVEELHGPRGKWYVELTEAGIRGRALAVEGWDTMVFIAPYTEASDLEQDPRLQGALLRYQIRSVWWGNRPPFYKVLVISDGAIIVNTSLCMSAEIDGSYSSFLISRAP